MRAGDYQPVLALVGRPGLLMTSLIAAPLKSMVAGRALLRLPACEAVISPTSRLHASLPPLTQRLPRTLLLPWQD